MDPLDRSSVLVQRTLKGAAFLRDLRSIMGEAATIAKRAPAVHEPSQRRATTSA